jgi:Zn finger protein HypA/HybF involved in hydrogenase expression
MGVAMKVIFETDDSRLVIPLDKEPYIEIQCSECGGHGYVPHKTELLNCHVCKGHGSQFYNGDMNE